MTTQVVINKRLAGLKDMEAFFHRVSGLPRDGIISKDVSDSHWKQYCMVKIEKLVGNVVVQRKYKYIKSGSYGMAVMLSMPSGKDVVFKLEKIYQKPISEQDTAARILRPLLINAAKTGGQEMIHEFKIMHRVFRDIVLRKKAPGFLAVSVNYMCRIKNMINSAKAGGDTKFVNRLKDWSEKNVAKQAVENAYRKVQRNHTNEDDHVLFRILRNQYVRVTLMEKAYSDFHTFLIKQKPNIQWLKGFFFRLLFSLAVAFEQYGYFQHNDLHMGNVFVLDGETSQTEHFKFGNVCWKIPGEKFTPVVADFGMSSLPGHKNQRVGKFNHFGMTNKKDGYYDIHTFFNNFYNYVKSHSKLYPNIVKMKNGKFAGFLDKEFEKFMNGVIPPHFQFPAKVNHGRIVVEKIKSHVKIAEKDLKDQQIKIQEELEKDQSVKKTKHKIQSIRAYLKKAKGEIKDYEKRSRTNYAAFLIHRAPIFKAMQTKSKSSDGVTWSFTPKS